MHNDKVRKIIAEVIEETHKNKPIGAIETARLIHAEYRSLDIHEIRQKGREYCQTDGSTHYRENSIDPIEYAIANGMIEDFCLINIIKYASRFKYTRNLDDLKKVSDYAHILAGVELEKQCAEVVEMTMTEYEICKGCSKEKSCEEPCEKWYEANDLDVPGGNIVIINPSIKAEAEQVKSCETCGDKCNNPRYTNYCKSNNYEQWMPSPEVTD